MITTTPATSTPKQSFINRVADFVKTGGGQTLTYQRQNPAPVIPIDRIREAIAHNETGIIKDNPYAFTQFSGKKALGGALGRYQVTAGELATYAPRFLGRTISPQEFVASPSAQDTYINNKIDFYAKQGHTPQEIADIHRRGITKAAPAGSGRYQDPEYVRKFESRFYPTLKEAGR